MKNCSSARRSPRLRALRGLFFRVAPPLLVASALLMGCGGGGSSTPSRTAAVVDGPIPAPPAPGPSQTPTPPPGPQPPQPGPARDYVYPNFGSASHLTLVANYQPSFETSSTTAQVVATLNSMQLPVAPRSLVGETSDEGEELHLGCALPEVEAMTRLMGISSEPVDPVVLQQVQGRFQDLPEGAEEEFFVATTFREARTKKVLQPQETLHCTIFSEVDQSGDPILSRERALEIAAAFDSSNPQRPGSGIYQQVREVFGSEWNQNPPGGLDGDMKIVIVFLSPSTIGRGVLGYTSPADATPNAGNTSNRGEIMYINTDRDEYQTLATIAHEFQHIVNINQKVNRQGANPSGARQELVSINEGLSSLAEEVCGFDLDSGNEILRDVANDYLRRPQVHSFFDFRAAGLGYGQGYLYFKYIYEQFGQSTVRAIATSTQVGKANLDARLPISFDESFRRWTVANYATNLSGSVPAIYRYPSGFRTEGSYPAGSLVGPRTFNLTRGQSNASSSLRPWSTTYLVVDGGDGSDLEIDVEPIQGSPFGLIFERAEGIFTSFQGE